MIQKITIPKREPDQSRGIEITTRTYIISFLYSLMSGENPKDGERKIENPNDFILGEYYGPSDIYKSPAKDT